MDATPLTCAEVEERDLDTRYLARTLLEYEAEEFEAHYFACDRCWAAVHAGLEVLAVESTAAPEPAPAGRTSSATPSGVPPHAFPFRHRWIVAAAAAAAVIAVAIWDPNQIVDPPPPPLTPATMRGTGESMLVTATRDGEAVTATWTSIAGADMYIVRIFGPGGVLVSEERHMGTTIRIAPAAGASFPDTLLLDVRALGPLREIVAGSAVTAVLPSRDTMP